MQMHGAELIGHASRMLERKGSTSGRGSYFIRLLYPSDVAVQFHFRYIWKERNITNQFRLFSHISIPDICRGRQGLRLWRKILLCGVFSD